MDIPKFYRYNALDYMMFGYVNGLRKLVPSTNVKQAIEIFLKAYELGEDDYCFDTAYGAYYRILRAIVEMQPKGSKTDENIII